MTEWTKILYDKISKPSLSFCIKKKITANQVTIFNHVITLTLGCYFFSRGTYTGNILGLIVCIINGFLDYLDGDLARFHKSNIKLGRWLDSGFDVIIQNAVMGSIAIGCYKMGLPLIWVIMFFISNTANNFISFHYNAVFGFDSSKGNALFRDLMNKNTSIFNSFMQIVIDPTANFLSLSLFTVRYWIAIGCVFGMMPFCFERITIIGNLRWVIMFLVYSLYLMKFRKLYVVRALSALDEESDDFYKLRQN